MALTDINMADINMADIHPTDLAEWNSPDPTDSAAALDRLRVLHGEAGRNFREAQFLARAPGGCVVLMLTGALALVWASAAGGVSLKASFAWAALALFGILAIIRLHIRGFARSLRRTPLAEAAADLRLLLLYSGLVWGGGAFLIMPELPPPALVFLFAAAPGTALAFTLRDAKGFAAFAGPASLLTAGASLLGAWPLDLWVAGAIGMIAAAQALVFWWPDLRQMLPRAPAHS